MAKQGISFIMEIKLEMLEISVFQSSETRWGVQGLEYDIFAEGETMKEALENFGVSLAAELAYCERYKVPLSSIGKAPKSCLRGRLNDDRPPG